jgi:ABC-type glycerol-3-phosphate transport system substrate-binding protein
VPLLTSGLEASNILRVWALEDNTTVRQAIALFRDEHPDVEVKFEIGLDSKGMTAEDALRALNIEILAGSGPDIFILDGLPIKAFIEQGVLHDLTDLYSEAMASGLYYENILSAFVRDGECRVLPMHFTFPLVIASKDTLDRLDSLPSLVGIAEEIITSNPDSELFCDMAILDDLLIAYYPELISQGELSEEALMQFFECVGTLAQILEPNNNQASVLTEVSGGAQHSHGTFDSIAWGRFSLYEEPSQILIDQTLFEQDFGFNEVITQNTEVDFATGALSLNQYNTYIPMALVAINAQKKDTKPAEAFVQMMLSEKYQKSGQRNGLSVLRSVFPSILEPSIGIGLADGSELNIKPLSKEVIGLYQSLFASLDTPVVIDSVVETSIYEQLQRYLDGEVGLEEAVDACARKINLYLAE